MEKVRNLVILSLRRIWNERDVTVIPDPSQAQDDVAAGSRISLKLSC